MGTATASGVEVPADERLAQRVRRKLSMPTVSFPELVWLHHLRQQELDDDTYEPYTGPAEKRYRQAEAQFEAEHGKIVSSYWCTDDASAVALTIKRRPFLLADTVQLHWATDWATRDKPKLMTLLYETESLAVRVQEVLRDTSRRIAIQSLFNVISYLLGFGETKRAEDPRACGEVGKMTHKHLGEIDKYYRRAASRSGQIVYVGGMLLGMAPVILLALITWIFFVTDNAGSTAIGIFCLCAGAVGALMSVLARLSSGSVRVDWEFGKDTLRTLGALRPAVGAVFGLITYFALKSGIVNLTDTNVSAYYIVFAFVAGFSERFTQDMLLGSTFGAAGVKTSKSEPEPPATPEEIGDAVTAEEGT